ncbi:hypothetical protein ACKKBF_B03675 [Auxenochlorella protothecoides x Auxenochlorella symbiontica]
MGAGSRSDIRPSFVGLVVAAIFVPPAAVLINRNAFDTHFFINLILTFLAWIPGVIHALWVVFKEPADIDNYLHDPLTRPGALV